MDTLEVLARGVCPHLHLVNFGCDVNIPGLGQTKISPFRLCLRTVIVILTTLIVSYSGLMSAHSK